MVREVLTITNAAGLHARPAAAFSQKAKQFDSTVKICFHDAEYNVKSVVSLLTAGNVNGSTIELVVDGNDEREALAALLEMAQNGFGE